MKDPRDTLETYEIDGVHHCMNCDSTEIHEETAFAAALIVCEGCGDFKLLETWMPGE